MHCCALRSSLQTNHLDQKTQQQTVTNLPVSRFSAQMELVSLTSYKTVFSFLPMCFFNISVVIFYFFLVAIKIPKELLKVSLGTCPSNSFILILKMETNFLFMFQR